MYKIKGLLTYCLSVNGYNKVPIHFSKSVGIEATQSSYLCLDEDDVEDAANEGDVIDSAHSLVGRGVRAHA